MRKRILVGGQWKNQEFEICVLCRRQTDVPLDRDIEMRANYIIGVGQLCYDCYLKIYPKRTNDMYPV